MSAGPYQVRLTLCGLGLSVCLAVSASGCAVSGKSVSIDSTSRMPWFGLELKERARKSSQPAYRSIGRDSTSPVRIESLGLAPAARNEETRLTPLVPLALPTTVLGREDAPDEAQKIDFR